jgi:hypothetical protein
MKLLVSAAIAAAIAAGALSGAGPANAAQGGTDGLPLNPHAWFKVARSELQNWNTRDACLSTGLSQWNCDPLVKAINGERNRHPQARGYWAEFYWNSTTKSGTW